uniref:NADH-ubiquinone oxidoreductase chain 5 n=1 Tax=Curculionidae sp. 6 AH-2016 TaxID=1903832 RepID=A0A343C2S6_9CUCU|nr:NADH dehydrogenase subunit 5 [Curculionidae sp. 6 AH-2016]
MYFVLFLSLAKFIFFMGLYLLYKELDIFVEFSLLYFNSVSMEMVFFIDYYSLLFISFVFFISSMIINYSEEYMSMDKNFKCFIILVVLFVFSMMFMILSPNLVSILLGWDGLGLVSYLLVIYYQNIKSYNAGMLTALSNRLGDAALLMSIAWMINLGNWSLIYYTNKLLDMNILYFLVGFLILAAMTKSAQIPFSSWLPAAMAAPTPVSSLVHSSTLVTAGVYLLFRINMMIPNEMLFLLLLFSILTMFMAGLCANYEFDLKKIIALSTLSQLGMMISILCLGSSDLAFFHLLIHALFKALLFMCAGVMIHNLGNCQDIRYMGNLYIFMPLTCTCMNISNFALCGLPFISGFYSKDLIAEALSMSFISLFIYVVFFLSVGLTVSYSMRLSYYLFFGKCNLLSLNNLSDSDNKIMLQGMLGLVFLVILKGSLLVWIMFLTPYFIVLPFWMKMMTLAMILLGMLIGYEISILYLYNSYIYKFMNMSFFLSGMWNMPILSTFGVNLTFLSMGKIFFKNFDYGWFEFYGSQKLFFLSKKFIFYLQSLSFNHMKVFMTMIFLFIFYLIFFI